MKRAFITLSGDQLRECLNIKDGVSIVAFDPRYELGSLVRLHLRGDCLPEYAECKEGETAAEVTLEEISHNTHPESPDAIMKRRKILLVTSTGPWKQIRMSWLKPGDEFCIELDDGKWQMARCASVPELVFSPPNCTVLPI